MDQLQSFINQFHDHKNDENLDYKFWHHFFKNYLLGYSTSRYALRPVGGLFRARKNWDNKTKTKIEYFESVEDFYAPKSSDVNSIGRCNEINDPVFYCSDDPLTTMFEIQPNTGDEFSIMEFACPKMIEQLNVVCHSKLSRNNSSLGGLLQDHYKIDYASRDYIAFVLQVDELIAKEFETIIDETKRFKYNITIGIYRFYCENNEEFSSTQICGPPSGLIYPSVAKNQIGVNFALNVIVYKRYISPDSAHKYRVIKKRSPFDFDIQKISVAYVITSQGKILWNNVILPVERICS
jgi:hypothetical protein